MVFYMQDSISPRFHDGSAVAAENIKKDWKFRVTQKPDGQWFTLNNRMLFAYNSSEWATPCGSEKYLMDMGIPMSMVEIIPFDDARQEFDTKFTTKDNGNTCYMRGKDPRSKDWICSPNVCREHYYKYVLCRTPPTEEYTLTLEEKLEEKRNIESLLALVVCNIGVYLYTLVSSMNK